jgi:phosphoribosyl 1,2-cyclic phosphate phosphodiesterase
MKVTFLGTGTSQGVPVIACNCAVCKSKDFKDNRLRCSILLSYDDKNIVIDTGPDFRQQMLRKNVSHLDAVLYTHEHKDHVAGLDDVRAFNYFQSKHMDIYLSKHVEVALKREFAYIFAEDKYPGIPLLNLHIINNSPFQIFGKTFLPIEVKHYKMPVFGYRFGDFAYITDAKTIDKIELDKLFGLKYLVINALRHETHVSHLTLNEAIEIVNYLKPEKTFLTHISHQLGLHEHVSKDLPENVEIAYDGLEINF